MIINHPIDELMMHVRDWNSLSIQHSEECRVTARDKKKQQRRTKDVEENTVDNDLEMFDANISR